MSKCIHNQQIRYFCTKWSCNYSTIAGCSKCFKYDHIHLENDDSQLIDIDQLNKLLLKYTFSNKIKPQCINLQQSFYSFFKKIQNQLKQIITTIDQICKNVVNNIGFPYICYKNYFTVFKRIKNKQYNRLPIQQFRKFVSQTRLTSIQKLCQLQQKLYLKQINNSHQMIKQIDHMIGSFENVTKYYQQKTKFIHDNTQYIKNKQIVQKIKNQLKSNNLHKNQQKNIYNININTVRNARTISQQQTSKKCLGFNSINQNHYILQTKSNKKLNTNTPISFLIPNKNQTNYKSTQKDKIQAMKTSITQFVHQKNIQQPSKQKTQLTKLNNKQKRSTSIDSYLPKNSKLQQKFFQLKSKKNNQKQTLKIQSNPDNQQSKSIIKNNNLPGGQEKSKVLLKIQDQILQVVPITRKLHDKIYDHDDHNQAQSPLIKSILRSKNPIIQPHLRSLSQPQHQPQISNHPQKQHTTTKVSPEHQKSKSRKNSKNLKIKLQKVKQTPNLQLTQMQQKSFMLLIDSLKLKTTSAIPILQKALQQCNKNLSAAEYLSYLYLQSNQFQKCISLCTKYLSVIAHNKNLTHQKTLFINNKSSALNNIGRYSQSIKLLQNCPITNIITLKNLANAYLGLGLFDQAIPLYRQIIKQTNDDQIFYNFSSCLYLNNDLQQAKQTITSALSLQPNKKQYLQLQSHIINLIKISES